MKLLRTCVVLAAVSTATASAADQTESNAETRAPASTASSQMSTLATGDLIILKSAADGFTPLLNDEKGSNGNDKFIAPPRTKLKVTTDESGILTVVVKDLPCDVKEVRPKASDAAGPSAPEGSAVYMSTTIFQVASTITVSETDCKALKPMVKEGRSYRVSSTKLREFGYNQLGFIYGGLIIPYKYFRHDKSLEPGTTIGPFIGYRMGQTGWGISLIGTYAVTEIRVKVKDGDTLKDRNFWGLSSGIGLMFDVTKSETPFRAGIMWGRDRVGSNNVEVYPHDGKGWIAAQLGWEFSR
ncbi:hypothetical protein [Sphaerotilus microaerophilus]|uniref:Outer membrane protein beta-barrel domain-containing protein n=1 Tax=Sphaerotilus microaerophilus TaxID=2914710 RepID=A0ABM7YHM0_9BURK|nr:hypothetical protein [Sphaerotilus sp. FB-5]BDI03679.1 hypothetical protein CATMQ487_06490 [Sphaerotilus sp. FB-5]